MRKDRDELYGLNLRGTDRPMPFVNPYRTIGELNPIELQKLERHPLEIADAIIDTYSVDGPAGIAKVPGEVERLKWAGIYPQKQGGDAFMMRVKVPGGLLTAAQIREIGVVADAFGEGPDGTREPRVRLPLRGPDHPPDRPDPLAAHGGHPPGLAALAAVGLTTVQACGDSARNVVCCPLSGVDADEAFDAQPVARAVSDFFTGNREYANLPRKFKLSISGCVEDCAQAGINDVGLWPARADDGELGFNLLVGGGLSDGERMASDIDVFVPPGPGRRGEPGHRPGLRRARQPGAPGPGPDAVPGRGAGARGVPGRAGHPHPLRAGPLGGVARHPGTRGDHVGVHPQKQEGLVYVGISVPVGRMVGLEMVEAGRLADTYGDGTVRIGSDQNLTFTGVPEDRVDDLLAEPLLAKYSPFPGPFTRGVVACTGTEFCRYAIVETKERAVKWARFLDDQLADEPVGARPVGRSAGGPDRRGVVRMHFSGCSASCAQPQIADIGFRGDVAKVGNHLAEAVDIGMGGSLGSAPGFIDWLEHARPVNDVPDALLRVVRRYQEERREQEPFANWARRTGPDELRVTLAAEGTGTPVTLRTGGPAS